MLKALLFDVDGTFAETEEFHRRAFNEAFAEHGLAIEWSPEEYRVLLRVTGGKERITAYFRGAGVAISAEHVLAIHRSKNAAYARMLADTSGEARAGLRPGVLRLLREGREAGILLGIATTTSLENIDALLRPRLGAQWAGGFACIVAGDQVAHKKPAPDVYLACLERLGIGASEAVAIEDSPAGIGAARDAGIAVLVTPSRYTAGEDFTGADWLVTDLGEPGASWAQAHADFPDSRVGIVDLQRLVAAQGAARLSKPGTGPIAASTELAQ